MIEIETPDYCPAQTETEPVLNADTQMSYDEFFRECLVKNRPCVFRPGLTDEWESTVNWVSNGAPNFQYMRQRYGCMNGPVANCQKFYRNRQTRKTMNINDYIDHWLKFKQNNNDDILYLKDWHCVKQSGDNTFYQVPKYFASDWLNEYCVGKNIDDYMFVYMGPKGSWTPFHVDVLTSYSWSANVCGRKKWLFFPPGQENLFLNNRGFAVHDTTSTEVNDSNEFKNYNRNQVQNFEFIQEPGQVVFVPSGWYHQVWNLEDAISVNHNWINGCNILIVWSRLKLDLESVTKEITDCQDMDNWQQHCQLILKLSFGLDYKELFNIIEFIGQKRLDSLRGNLQIVNFNQWLQGRNHSCFDLKQIRVFLKDFIQEIEGKSLTSVCPIAKAQVLLSQIEDVV